MLHGGFCIISRYCFAPLTIIATKIFFCSTAIANQIHEPIETSDGIPKYIQRYKVRIDSYSGKPVISGRLESVGGVPTYDNLLKPKQKFKSEVLKKVLQCPILQPDIDEFRGGIELWNYLKPTSNILESSCAWLETNCHPWKRCQPLLLDFKNGKYPSSLNEYTGFFYWVKLFRIADGKLCYDWPWGVERFSPGNKAVTTLLLYILDKVSDIPDSAFFLSEQQSFSSRLFPFPSMSASPSFQSPELSFPWPESFKAALQNYRHFVNYHHLHSTNATSPSNSTSTNTYHPLHYLPWSNKTNKAAYYASLTDSRQLMFDLAASHPDLIEARWIVGGVLEPWHPESPENSISRNDVIKHVETKSKEKLLHNESKEATTPGYTGHILGLHSPQPAPHNPSSFKYIIVLDGGFGDGVHYSLSGRLAGLLATSGAVILLQRSEFDYHFSARLQPWVHYVPLSHSTADVAAKLQWLRSHDALAKRIAENAANFAKSHLRLEDYYCYMIHMLESIGRIEANTSSLVPFNPQPLNASSSYSVSFE